MVSYKSDMAWLWHTCFVLMDSYSVFLFVFPSENAVVVFIFAFVPAFDDYFSGVAEEGSCETASRLSTG